MKKQIMSFVATIGFLFVVSSISAFAQTPLVKANIPFDFQVNGKAMAAGEYTIVQPTSPADTIIVRSVQKPSPALAIFRRTASTEVATKSQLVFRRYGNQYFMANMQVQGVAGNLELLTTKAERNLVKELSGRFLANNKVEPELVTVALTQ